MNFWKQLNLPNKLTVLRMVMVPVLWIVYLCIPADWLLMSKEAGFGLRNLLALLLFAAASITDLLDGKIARSRHLITSFGKFLDPIADKMLVNSTLILLVYTHSAAVLPVLLMISRDLVVDGLRLSAASKGKVVSAGFPGKLKTVLQMISIILLLMGNWPFVYLHFPLAQITLWAAALVSLYSGWIYFVKLRKYVMESM
ncbi:CDP-diacylglycerol--glycerol-3-phosphate 3-phosphatidyltransferase [Allobaculum fili]|uniref:CDP-diacylglycerol--glycerol-3-phosphate 3-phosphatidyltransferase n=1 Tax=Allobaculum fili TaxID=2834460 RepID=UPI001E3189FB|nr:CDP-diacylglycerol--glycerol-3-phosphate 3-phosphatidyltransferase [Allobaculum fili]